MNTPKEEFPQIYDFIHNKDQMPCIGTLRMEIAALFAGYERQLQIILMWEENARNREHIWEAASRE